MTESLKEIMNNIYVRDLKEIPWNIPNPPELLIRLLEEKTILPGKTLDVGCGIGNYSIFLAQKGFTVTGIDLSDKAVNIAKENASEQNLPITFLYLDLLNDESVLQEEFDFVLEWEVMHHIFPNQRLQYLTNLSKMMKPGCKYLSVHFSENNSAFGGEGKFRKTSMNTELYFSSISEMRKLYSKYFRLLDLSEKTIQGKMGKHKVIYALSEK